MRYLEINNGCIVHKKEIDELSNKVAKEIGEDVGVRCCLFQDDIDTLESLAPICVEMDPNHRLSFVTSCWFGKIAQRIGAADLVHKAKSHKMNELFMKAKNYNLSVQQSFFRKRPIKRVDSLYSSYKETPGLTGQFIEMQAKSDSTTTQNIWNDIWNTEKHLWIQSYMLLEHRARLSIIKNALDHIIRKEKSEFITIAGKTVSAETFYEQLMPDNFRRGLSILEQHEHAIRIPYLLQIFIEVCGGFYINNETDIGHISQISGIPQEDIVPCLKLMDEIFPTQKGWFSEHENELVMMKFLPAVIRGIGCFFRQRVYEINDYSKISQHRGYWLTRWHNALYSCLESYLGVPDE